MTQVSIAGTLSSLEPLALIARDGSVWIAVKVRWWDLATVLWWLLTPADRRAWVTLHTSSGQTLRTRAVQVARRSVFVNHMHRVKN